MSKRTLCEMLPILAAYTCYRSPAAAGLLQALQTAQQHGCAVESRLELTELNLLVDGIPFSKIHEKTFCDISTADRRIDAQLRALILAVYL